MAEVVHRNRLSTVPEVVICLTGAKREVTVHLAVLAAESMRCQAVGLGGEAGGLDAPAHSWKPRERWTELAFRSPWTEGLGQLVEALVLDGSGDEMIAFQPRLGVGWMRLGDLVLRRVTLTFEAGRMMYCDMVLRGSSVIDSSPPAGSWEGEEPADGPVSHLVMSSGKSSSHWMVLAGKCSWAADGEEASVDLIVTGSAIPESERGQAVMSVGAASGQRMKLPLGDAELRNFEVRLEDVYRFHRGERPLSEFNLSLKTP